MTLDEIPDVVRSSLPPDLADAQLAGTEKAGADESVRLYGPPGTGKSTQSALRLATVATEKDLPPSQLTVVTYRSALAGVVRQRLIDWGVFEKPEGIHPASPDAGNPFRFWNTIHATAARATDFMDQIDPKEDLSGMVDGRAIREFTSEVGIQAKPRSPWSETRWTVFYKLYNFAKSNLLDLGEYRFLDDEDLAPMRAVEGGEKLFQDFRDEWGQTASPQDVAEMWESFKRSNDVFDFFELLTAAVDGRDPPTRVLVVDEYHDVTPLMSRVAEAWIDAADTAIVAGDPDQVVNSYAGASPRFFETLAERLDTDLPIVQLRRSWRCPDEHFQAAAKILREERTPPQLKTDGPGEILRHNAPEIDHDEENWMLPPSEIETSPVGLWEEYGPDIMFLARTQKQASGVAAALDEEGIVYVSQDDVGGDWEKRLALLRGLEGVEGVRPPEDSAAGEDFETFDDDRKSVKNRALGVDAAKTLIQHTNGHYLDEDRDEILDDFEDRRRDDVVPLSVLADFVTRKWWLRYGNGKPSISELTRLDARASRSMGKAWERYSDQYFDLNLAEGTRVLTIHASKGAEAKDVVVYDGITGRIQDSLGGNKSARENEARTWYVALTRAEERLHIARDVFPWTDPYLPGDLEPIAADYARRARGEPADD